MGAGMLVLPWAMAQSTLIPGCLLMLVAVSEGMFKLRLFFACRRNSVQQHFFWARYLMCAFVIGLYL